MVFFFYGPNQYAARQEVRRMTAAYVKKTGSDLGLERIDGATLSLKQLQANLQASPFLTTSRLVIVEGFGKTKVTSDELEQSMGVVPETTVAVFMDPDVDQRTAYYKTMIRVARPVKFETLTTAQLLNWITQETTRLGGEIGRAGAQALLDAAGEDQWRLSGELSKLVSYDPVVTPDTVSELVIPTLNSSIFDLVEAMTSGRGKAALEMYHRLLNDKANEIYLLTMVIWQLRNLLLAKTARGMSAGEVAKAAGISPYVAGKAATAAQKFDEETLKEAYLAAADCEFKIKTGREPAQRAVERLILEIATRRPA